MYVVFVLHLIASNPFDDSLNSLIACVERTTSSGMYKCKPEYEKFMNVCSMSMPGWYCQQAAMKIIFEMEKK